MVWPQIGPLGQSLGLHTQHMEDGPRVLVNRAAQPDVDIIIENYRAVAADLNVLGPFGTQQLEGISSFAASALTQ